MSEVNAFINLVFFIYIALNIVFGFICAHIAFNKNRSPLGWFILGFFLSIIGIAIIAVASKIDAYDDDEPKPHSGHDNHDYIDCPYCAERIKRQAKLCRFCNSSLSAIPPVTKTQFDEQMQRKMWAKLFQLTNNHAIRFASIMDDNHWQCICGQLNTFDDVSCQKCGSDKTHVLAHYTKEAIAASLSNPSSINLSKP